MEVTTDAQEWLESILGPDCYYGIEARLVKYQDRPFRKEYGVWVHLHCPGKEEDILRICSKGKSLGEAMLDFEKKIKTFKKTQLGD